MDETFWKGTLSEGKVKIVYKHVEIVKELARRGIICSISSKNDYEPAKAELEKFGVWDYFIFPSINWNPKGENVKGIVKVWSEQLMTMLNGKKVRAPLRLKINGFV